LKIWSNIEQLSTLIANILETNCDVENRKQTYRGQSLLGSAKKFGEL